MYLQIAATITVPFDVVKTHQQIEFGSDFFSENGKILITCLGEKR